jgi:hypothetical protein
MFTIDNIKIDLTEENNGIRLITQNDDNVILPNQTMTSIENIVKDNFQIVKSHYQFKSGVPVSIDEHDLSIISLKIVLHYLYMYNMWRITYPQHKDQELKFLSKDFKNPNTVDMIIRFFKNKYPETYAAKCQLMLGMSTDEFSGFEKGRQNFHDMW